MAEDRGQTGWGVPEGNVDEGKMKGKQTWGNAPQSNKDLTSSSLHIEPWYMIKTIKCSVTVSVRTSSKCNQIGLFQMPLKGEVVLNRYKVAPCQAPHLFSWYLYQVICSVCMCSCPNIFRALQKPTDNQLQEMICKTNIKLGQTLCWFVEC